MQPADILTALSTATGGEDTARKDDLDSPISAKLTAEERDLLSAAAKRNNKSQADVIRDALRALGIIIKPRG